MEENQQTQPQNPSNFPSGSGVSFPSVNEPPKSSGPKMLLIFGILILVGILGFVIFKSANTTSEEVPEPTPFDNFAPPIEQEPTPFPTPTASSSATPKASDKSAVKIQVQNGTGISGEAAYLETQLKNLGYTNIAVGNASSQNATATDVTFSKSLAQTVVDELTTKLKALYTTVNVKTTTSGTFDVVIITGLRKGATAKPASSPLPISATGTPRATSSPTPSGSASPTATP